MKLKSRDRTAITELRNRVINLFPEAEFILFGSKATGKDDAFSDIDVMILLKRTVGADIEKKIFEIGFEAGMEHGVVFGITVEESSRYHSAMAEFMPFYQNVANQGIPV